MSSGGATRTMNRIFKIFALILLVPLCQGLGSGCSGGFTGGGPLGGPGGFNGAASGGGDGTPGGGDYRPSGQPTGGIIPNALPGKFYMLVKFNTTADAEAMQSQCSQFVVSAYQDAKRRDLLYALNDSPVKTNGTDGTVQPPTSYCHDNVKDSNEQCDDNNNSCCVNCHFAGVGDKCQDPAGPAGKCTKDYVCVPPPVIRGTVKVYRDYSKAVQTDQVTANYPKTTFEIDPCKPENVKIFENGMIIEFNFYYRGQASVELWAEVTDPKTGGKTYVTDDLQGTCPTSEQFCRVPLNLKRGNQVENKPLSYDLIDFPGTVDLRLDENITPEPLENAP